jgi:hypothetical protein
VARSNVQGSAHDEAWGWSEISRLTAEIATLPNLNDIEIEPGSALDIDGRIQDYDVPSDQVLFLLAVATDHLDSFGRMVHGEFGGLPAMSGYTLLRAAIEAASTAIWLRLPGTANSRVARSLWMIVTARDDVEGLARRLGLSNPAGYERMKARVAGIIESRKGLRPSMIERVYRKTTIINEVDRHVPRRIMTALEAWQACSGITHSNRTSALMFLAREEIGRTDRKMLVRMTASAVIIAEILGVAVACVRKASDQFIEQAHA